MRKKEEKKDFFKKSYHMKKHKNLHNNVIVTFCKKMSYNYKKVSLSGNKNNLLITETYLE